MAAERPIVAGRVTPQARTMVPKSDQLTASLDRNQPTDTTDPILQWVVLIGMPTLDASSTVMAAPSSTEKPLDGVSVVMSSPTV